MFSPLQNSHRLSLALPYCHNGVEVFVRQDFSYLFSAGFVVHICIADVSADLHFFTVKGQKLLSEYRNAVLCEHIKCDFSLSSIFIPPLFLYFVNQRKVYLLISDEIISLFIERSKLQPSRFIYTSSEHSAVLLMPIS